MKSLRIVGWGAVLLFGLAGCGGDPSPAPGGDGGGGGGGGTASSAECDDSGEGYWPQESATLECEVLKLVNAHRAAGADCHAEGVFAPAGALKMDPQLRKAARLHSLDMGERGYFSHWSTGGPNGDSLRERVASAGFTGWWMLGENIAAGRLTPESVVSVWMMSAGHCANIMRPEFNLIGIGRAAVTGSPAEIYWTQDFAAKR